MCCSVLQCVAVCCSVLQCVAVCCSVLQCVAVCMQHAEDALGHILASSRSSSWNINVGLCLKEIAHYNKIRGILTWRSTIILTYYHNTSPGESVTYMWAQEKLPITTGGGPYRDLKIDNPTFLSFFLSWVLNTLSYCNTVTRRVWGSVTEQALLGPSQGIWRCKVSQTVRDIEIIGLFCRIWSLSKGFFAKETCNFKEHANRSHPISMTVRDILWDILCDRFCAKHFCKVSKTLCVLQDIRDPARDILGKIFCLRHSVRGILRDTFCARHSGRDSLRETFCARRSTRDILCETFCARHSVRHILCETFLQSLWYLASSDNVWGGFN